MKFIVDRQKWYRGQGVQSSRLLRADGRRCCIGFVVGQCGIPDEQILGAAAVHSRIPSLKPRIYPDQLSLLPNWMTETSGPVPVASFGLSEAYGRNDSPLIADDVREAKLKALFASHGDELEFIN